MATEIQGKCERFAKEVRAGVSRKTNQYSTEVSEMVEFLPTSDQI